MFLLGYSVLATLLLMSPILYFLRDVSIRTQKAVEARYLLSDKCYQLSHPSPYLSTLLPTLSRPSP
jgi:hypothetical protein